MISSDPQKLYEFLHRGVESILPSREHVETQLQSGKQMKIYLGIDPTGPSLHIGHAIALNKLAQLQKLGHQIVLLMGDFTARIGDPTDKLATRKTLTTEEIAENLKNYQAQASKIISFEGENPAQIAFNNDWLGKMNFADVLQLCSQTTAQRLLERDMFQKRLEEGKPIYVHELLYPLMQGYDSVALDVDGEIGGNDQLFNMLMGRELLKEKNKDKFVLCVKLLADPTGKKMGKSEGNMITLNDSPKEMYGKVMSWTDGMILGGFELCTTVTMDEITQIGIGMQNGENPMEYKKRLAREIIQVYYSPEEAALAETEWQSTFSDKQFPEDAPVIAITKEQSILDWLVETEMVSSKSEARRLITAGGIKIITDTDEIKITDPNQLVIETIRVKVGAKKFIVFKK